MPLFASVEPVLPMSDIQGIVVPGFFKPHHTLIGLRFPQEPRAIVMVKAFLRTISKDISSAKVTLRDRRSFRKYRSRKKHRPPEKEDQSRSLVLQAIAFTYSGLLKLKVGPERIPSSAFQRGMVARSPLLGDPVEGDGSPKQWIVGGTKTELDALLIVAGNDRASVDKCAMHLRDVALSAGITVSYYQNGDDRPDMPGHEHFGFRDGVSQPGIRGRASGKKTDFITDRHIAPSELPESLLFGYPGQDLVWPGEFVLGLPASGPDPLIAGAITKAVPPWTANGSFLVFRRLEQDVGLFWRTMRDLARDLATKPGFERVDEDWLAARLMGRWPSGAPVNRTPDRDIPALGSELKARNHFRFDSDTRQLKLRRGFKDEFPMASADPLGITCPLASHLRKTNTRDSASDMGGRDSTYTRRLLRVGIAFGPPLQDRFAEKKEDPFFRRRGLLFLSIQASIEDQFEFLSARWINDAVRPKMPGGHDIVVGQNASPTEGRERRCVIFGSGIQQAGIRTNCEWIIPTGGGYFFVPSISALRNHLAGNRTR